MECKTLEIMVLSAKNLKNVNHLSMMNVHVVVTVSNDPNTKKKTPVAKGGGTNPQWNYPIKFTFTEAHPQLNQLFLIFKLVCDHSLRGDKDIGVVQVPVKELSDDDDFDSKSPRYVIYQVREPCGSPKGEFSFAYKFTGKIAGGTIEVDVPPVPAYPALRVAVPYQQTEAGTDSPYQPLAGCQSPARGQSPAGFPAPNPIATPRLSGYPTLNPESPAGYPTTIPITGYEHLPLGGYPLPTPLPVGYTASIEPQAGCSPPMSPPAGYPAASSEPPVGYPAPPAGYPALPPEPPAVYPTTIPITGYEHSPLGGYPAPIEPEVGYPPPMSPPAGYPATTLSGYATHRPKWGIHHRRRVGLP